MNAGSEKFIAWLAANVLPHEPALRRWLERRARLERLGLTADDLIQETYTKLARMESVDHIQDARAYVFRVAYTVLLQELRKTQVVPFESIESYEALEVASSAPEPERALEIQQEMRILAGAINSMPEKCRIVFVLRKVHGYSQREIANQLGISENTVETHLARAVRKLMDFYRCSGIQPPNASGRLNSGKLENESRQTKRRHR